MKIRLPELNTPIKLLLAAALLGILLYLVDVREVAHALRSADGAALWMAAALLPVNLVLENVLWHTLSRRALPGVPFSRTFGSLMAGHSLGVFTPAGIGDLAARPLYLQAPDRWELALMALGHRLMDLAAIACAGSVALFFFARRYALPLPEAWPFMVFFGALLGLTLIGTFLLPRFAHRVMSRIVRKPKRRRHLDFLLHLTPPLSAFLLLLAFARFFVFTGQFVLLIHAVAPGASVVQSYMAAMLVQFAKFVVPSVTFSDLGVRETASVLLFSYVGVAEAASFGASILLYALNILTPALIGIPFALRIRLKPNAEKESEATGREIDARRAETVRTL